MKNLGILSPAFLAIAIVCFFFTFTDLTCNGTKLASLKGIDLVTGAELKPENMDGMKDMFKGLGGTTNDETPEEDTETESEEPVFEESSEDSVEIEKGQFGGGDDSATTTEESTDESATDKEDETAATTDSKDKMKPNPFAIAAFASAIIGILVFFVTKDKMRAILGLVFSLVGAVALLLLKVTFQKALDDAMTSGKGSEFASMIKFEFDFKAGFYIALVCFVAAAVINIIQLVHKEEVAFTPEPTPEAVADAAPAQDAPPAV